MSQTFNETGPLRGQVVFGREREFKALLGRTWWVFFVQGIFTMALGVAAIVWPDVAVEVFVVFLGINLVLLGIVRISMAFRLRRQLR